MARSGTPSFVRDQNQAAELAGLIRDAVTELEKDYAGRKDGLSRVGRIQVEQALERYRGWAEELDPDGEETDQAEPLQIRPASWSGSESATG